MPRDTKMSASAGEHYVCSMLARAGWAPALTRDGLERSDILAVKTNSVDRRMLEIQVKTVRTGQWPLGKKGLVLSAVDNEWYVLVILGDFPAQPRTWIVPRNHVAAAVWIAHTSWLTDPYAKPGTRNAGIEAARLNIADFAEYENRWDLLDAPTEDIPVFLPQWMREEIDNPRVGLPAGHPWRDAVPKFVSKAT